MTKAAETRKAILQKAFEIIYQKGYQMASIDEIIATTKVTKGAFYYHFKNKDEMGLAIIDEVVKPTVEQMFIKPLKDIEDPIKEIYEMTKHLLFDHPFLKLEYGCPAGNLAQEMTPWNAAFGTALAELINLWQSTIVRYIKKAKEKGIVRKNVSAQQVSYFVMSGYWGIRNFGKVYNSDACYHLYLKELKQYLNSLK